MKTIGVVGGMSWESTLLYYRLLNQEVARRLGGLHSARLVLWSVDFHVIETFQTAGRWEEAGEELAAAARALEVAGADFLVLATNTMHRVAPAIEAAVGIPLLHIADTTAEAVKRTGAVRVGLLGTRFTMEQDFYRGRLEQRHGLEVLVPGPEDCEIVHRVIYDELCRGQVLEESRRAFARILRRLAERGAQGVILGCTEIGLLVTPGDSPVPLFDTTEIHAAAAVERALAAGGGG